MTSLVKHFVKCAVVLSLLCAVSFAQPQDDAQSTKPKAAVYIKGNPPGRDVLRMAVNTFLIKTGMYQMIAVDAIDLLAQEHKRQMGGSVSDNEIARLGRDAGAQYVCVVERTELDGASYVTTSMVSVQSKIAEMSDMKELPRGERVISVIERQINAMLGIDTGEAETPEDGYDTESESAALQQPPSYEADNAYQSNSGVSSAPSSYSSSAYSRYDEPERERKPRPRRTSTYGVGGQYISDFGGVITWGNSGGRLTMPCYGGGVYFFVDWIYFEPIFGLIIGGGDWENSGAVSHDGEELPAPVWRVYGIVGALVKFPLIDVGSSVTLFPIYGIEYDVSGNDSSTTVTYYPSGDEVKFDGKEGRPDSRAMSAPWGKFGAGIDIEVSADVHLRVEALYGIRLTANKYEKDYVAREKGRYGRNNAEIIPGNGLTIRIGVGFKM
jgi:hypothetical protein